MLAASEAVYITLGGFLLLFCLLIAAIYFARKDQVTRVKLGVFVERERTLEPPSSDGETKIMEPWPGERKEKE